MAQPAYTDPENADTGKPGSQGYTETHADRLHDLEMFEEATANARDLSYRDVQWENGKQWTDEEVRVLKKRGQPVLTFNKIAKKINALRGQEVRTRVDPKARPRNMTGFHDDDAEAATDAIRYIADREKFDTVRSRVFHDLLTPGYGGCLVELKRKQVRGKEGEVEIKLRYVPWTRIFFDPYSSDPNFEDARYLGFTTWMDVEEAIERYPESQEVIEQTQIMGPHQGSDTASEDKPSFWWDDARRRIRVVEEYHIVKGVWYVCHFTASGYLRAPVETSLFNEDNEPVCPLVLTSGFVDEENNRFGYTRQLISPQEDINKRRSKALHSVNTAKIIAETGAFPDEQKALAKYSQPASITTVNAGYLQKGAVIFEKGEDISQGNMALLQDAYAQMDSIGPDIATLSQLPQSASGRAIMARQQAGTLEIESIFEHLRNWQAQVYRMIWYAIRIYWTNEIWVRVTDDSQEKGYRFTGLNKRMSKAQRVQELMEHQTSIEDALTAVNANLTRWQLPMIQQQVQQAFQKQVQQNPQLQAALQQDPTLAQKQIQQQTTAMVLQAQELQQEMIANQTALLDVDIVLDTTPDTAVLQQEEFEKFAETIPAILGHLPPEFSTKVAPAMLEMLLRAGDLREKKMLIKILQDATAPDPAAQQQQQKAQAQQDKMMMLQMQTLAAQLEEIKAGIGKIVSETQENQADSQKKIAEAALIRRTPAKPSIGTDNR
jgi:hypothetical protein